MIVPLALAITQGNGAPPPLMLPLQRRDSRRMATLKVGDRKVRLWVVAGFSGELLFLDRNGNGVAEPKEAVAWDRQDGTTADGSHVVGYQGVVDLPKGKRPTRFVIRLLESNTKDPAFKAVRDRLQVTEMPVPPNLAPGHVAPTLFSKTLAGKPIRFPDSFPGKLVLLDVWATWCGPCRQEIPFMKEAYARYRKRGFEIVSFSIDDPGMRKKVASFTKAVGETWTQAFEGRGWQSTVCRRYGIDSIPFMLLVDGATGRVVANGLSVRGPNLGPTIERALKAKGR